MKIIIDMNLSPAWTDVFRRAGWEAEPLGSAKRAGRDRLTAVMAAIDQRGLRRVRERAGLNGPVTRFLGSELIQAA